TTRSRHPRRLLWMDNPHGALQSRGLEETSSPHQRGIRKIHIEGDRHNINFGIEIVVEEHSLCSFV
ncbi:unnamed protein product, partial [Onchocerca ochengi]